MGTHFARCRRYSDYFLDTLSRSLHVDSCIGICCDVGTRFDARAFSYDT